MCSDANGNIMITGGYGDSIYFGSTLLIGNYYNYMMFVAKMSGFTLGINQNSFGNQSSNISIYPNPATDQLNITINNANFNSAEIKINNIIGECVLQSPPLWGGREGLDISSLSKGMYFVESIVDGKRSVMKLVKG